MNAKEAESQIVSGIFELESAKWRWMGGRASILVKPPPTPLPLRLDFYIPDNAPGRKVTLLLEGKMVAAETYASGGVKALVTPAAISSPGDSVTVTIRIDQTYSVPGDHRQLGMILIGAGFKQ